MPRWRVVAAVVLALALIVASCSDMTDSADSSEVANKQQKLEQAHRDGIEAHESMAKFGLEATEGECKAHYDATVANDLGDDDMVDLGRLYFVTGCMEELPTTQPAKAP
jgi:hypothetical protein